MGIPDEATIQMLLEPDVKVKLKVKTFKKGVIPVELAVSGTLVDLRKALLAAGMGPSSQTHNFYFQGNLVSLI